MAKSYTITADGNTTAYQHNGGRVTFSTFGTFDGATIKLQFSIDGTNYQDCDQGTDTFVTHTADGAGIFDHDGACKLRINTSGGGGSLSVTAYIAMS